MDDFASLTLGSSAAGRSVDVTVRFRDSNNQEHTITKTLTATAGNSSFVQGVARGNGSGAAGAGNFAARSNNPLGFLMGPGGRPSGTSAGIGIVPMAIGLVIVLAIAYVLYRKYIAKKPLAFRIPFIGKKENGKDEHTKVQQLQAGGKGKEEHPKPK